MGLVVAPIVEGKREANNKWLAELNGSSKEDMKDFNRRYGLTRHRAWNAETPNGPVVVALHEGPGADDFMGKLGSSDNEFDRRFAAHILEVHGMDVTKPPPGPMPELVHDSGN